MAKRAKKLKRRSKAKEPAGPNAFPPISGAGGGGGFPSFMDLSNQLQSPRRGVRELLKIYSESPWLRAVVGKIAKSVADTQWMLAAKKDASGRFIRSHEYQARGVDDIDLDKVELIFDHPLLDMFRIGTGNPRLNGFQVFQVTQEHLDLAGEAFWLLERNNLGIPVGIWPLPPSWIRTFPSASNPWYEVVATSSGVVTQIPVTEMIPFIDPDPEDPYSRGSGISGSLDDEIQVDEYAAKHQKSFFLNRARPDIIISGQNISKQDTARLEQKWLGDHQGFWKSFKPLFFSQKIDVKELSQTFESMQMVQIRKFERDTFISVFGAPPEKMGVIGESKRSTIAAADFLWNKDVIKPRVEMIRRTCQQLLVPMFDERLILTYKTPVVQDDEHKLKVMERAPWSLTVNEWRKDQGRASLGAAGDVLMIPLNNNVVPVKDENGKLLDQATFLEGTKGPEEPENDENDETDDDEKKFETVSIDKLITQPLLDHLEFNIEDLKNDIRSNRGGD